MDMYIYTRIKVHGVTDSGGVDLEMGVNCGSF